MEVVEYDIDKCLYLLRINNSDMELLSSLVERNKTYDQGITSFFDGQTEEFELQLSQADRNDDQCEIYLSDDLIGSLYLMVSQMTYGYVTKDLAPSKKEREELLERMKLRPQMLSAMEEAGTKAEIDSILKEMGL